MAKFKKNYVSELDQFLQELQDNISTKSASRLKEEEEYERIGQLRDIKRTIKPQDKIWTDF